MVELVIKIPESEIPKRQEIIEIPLHFIDGKVCEAGGYEFDVFPKGHGRKFEGIVVQYPPAELCTYPEYRGKPYFSIKYEENGEHFIGFGTYNPGVLSRYLRKYFITPT